MTVFLSISLHLLSFSLNLSKYSLITLLMYSDTVSPVLLHIFKNVGVAGLLKKKRKFLRRIENKRETARSGK